MIPKRIFSLLPFLIVCQSSFSQMSFRRNDSIPVVYGTDTLPNAWTGGLNFCQFSEIDLNLDGITDLVVFDRQGTNGGRITCFLNKGTPNKVSYVNAPEYVFKFPPIQQWMLLADYNCDGKADIFTHTTFGIMVYENTSTIGGGLSFRLATGLVYSDYGSGTVTNLYVSTADMPAIVDVDGDGDLDIITYCITPTGVEYHKNMSMERYGRCDSLNAFVLDHNCWGAYSDNGTNCQNYITTGVSPCPINRYAEPDTTHAMEKHSGNCILCFEADGDKDKDIMIGHVGCPNMTEMNNIGDTAAAIFINPDYTFPSYDVPLNMNVFPCGYLADVDNDGRKDVLFSPNNEQEGAAEDLQSVAWYKNVGTADSTILRFQQNNFLQSQMIDVGEGAFPVLHDYDGDGLADLFIGNFGYFHPDTTRPMIACFRNTGTSTHPAFTLVTRDFAGVSAALRGLTEFALTFGDLDGDGDADLVVGDYQGHLYYFEKFPGAPDNYVYQPGFFPNIHVGGYATPQLIDLNRDGKLDLVVGARNGRIYYYQNTGTATSPTFSATPTSDSLGRISTIKTGYVTGYAAPFFYEEAGSYKLLIGEESGIIRKYGNIDGNLNGAFTLLDPLVAYIGEGERSVPFGYDLNGDGIMDMMVGNFSGGVEFYAGSNALGVFNYQPPASFDFSFIPNPAENQTLLQITDFKFGEKYNFTLTDLLGKTLREFEFCSEQILIPTSDLPSGLYLGNVYSSGSSAHHKLVVRR